jgi:nucleoside-diphosphate-sugar epimerase
MKILVTGATGFLGKRVMEILKDKGCDPIGTGRNEAIGNHLRHAGFNFVQADLRDLGQVRRIFQKNKDIQYVVHCAALSSPWGRYADFYEANVLATDHIVKASVEYGVQRFVHISTPSIYFNYESRTSIKENDPLPASMVNHYAGTKKIAEDVVLEANIRSVILRPRGIFGPGDTTLFPRILKSWNRMPLINGGKAEIDITYLDNVVDAIWKSITCTLPGKQCFNITNGSPRKFIDILHLLSKELGLSFTTKNVSYLTAHLAAKLLELIYVFMPNKEPPITCYGVGLLAKSMTLDITKAKIELGYVPQVSIETGISRLAKWWKNEKNQNAFI